VNNVLVVAVHPDDETLGCGGTLLRHAAEGDTINWIIVTEMTANEGYSDEEMLIREEQIKKVAGAYNFTSVVRMGIPSTKVDCVPKSELVNKMSQVISDIRPGILYIPFHADVHSDHRLVFEACCSATKTFRSPYIRQILMMETISETEFAPPLCMNTFMPNYFVDISRFLESKMVIVEMYSEQIAEHPFPRSFESMKARAILRGAQADMQYAEGFMLIKQIV